MTAYLDTPVLLWLLQGEFQHLSEKARKVIDTNDLLVSPMVLLETDYLFEMERTFLSGKEVGRLMEAEASIVVCDLPFRRVTEAAAKEVWTRHPFDRLMVAQARARQSSPLITADRRMRNHYQPALW